MKVNKKMESIILPEEHYITTCPYTIICTYLNKFTNVVKVYVVQNRDCIQQKCRTIENRTLRTDFPVVPKVSRQTIISMLCEIQPGP